MKASLIDAAKGAIKLGVAGGVIFGIGFAFVTQDPSVNEVGPAPAEADISDFIGAPASKSAQFTEAMVALGLTPRVYDYNGNVMYFAVGGSEEKPRQLMHKIQDHLVEYGINKKNHSDMKPMKQVAQGIAWNNVGTLDDINKPEFAPLLEQADVMINDGDVVPTEVTDNRIEMVGYVKNREGKDVGELLEGDESDRKVANLMGGYKYIDLMWDGRTTEMSAVWSAEDFSADRMDGIGFDQSPPDPDVPVCMGCDRDYRMQTIDGKDAFSQNMYSTDLQVGPAYNYYRAEMQKRGWYEPGTQTMLSRMAEYLPDLQNVYEQGRVLHFERDGQAMQITVMPDDAGITNVITTHESRNAQLAHPEKVK